MNVKEKIVDAIEALASSVRRSDNENKTMKFSQSALNLAHTLSTLEGLEGKE